MNQDFLVVVDMQNDFVKGALGSKEAQNVIELAVEKITGFDGQVIVTYDTHDANYLKTQEGKRLSVPHCIKGTAGWELHPEIEAALPENVIRLEKPSFGSPELPKIIAANGKPESIEFIGLCTDICVVSNALICKAHFPETLVTVDASCCAGSTPENHKAALTTMQACQVGVVMAPPIRMNKIGNMIGRR